MKVPLHAGQLTPQAHLEGEDGGKPGNGMIGVRGGGSKFITEYGYCVTVPWVFVCISERVKVAHKKKISLSSSSVLVLRE